MINRKEVFEKYDGRCAYCGKELTEETMWIDHIISNSRREEFGLTKEEFHHPDNINPSCRYCNVIKRQHSIEIFRENIFETLIGLKNLPRLVTLHNLGVLITIDKPIKFYFETYEPGESK